MRGCRQNCRQFMFGPLGAGARGDAGPVIPSKIEVPGVVAKWQGKGLQNPHRGFDSRRRLSIGFAERWDMNPVLEDKSLRDKGLRQAPRSSERRSAVGKAWSSPSSYLPMYRVGNASRFQPPTCIVSEPWQPRPVPGDDGQVFRRWCRAAAGREAEMATHMRDCSFHR
jgi:hypothetical protein